MPKTIKRTVRPDLNYSMEGPRCLNNTMLKLAGKEIECGPISYSSPYDLSGAGWSWMEGWLVPLFEPKRGDLIEVSDTEGELWFGRTFLSEIKGANYPIHTVGNSSDIDNPPFHVMSYKLMREIKPEPEVKELTLSEIADKFNVSVEQLRIKD